MDNDSLGSSEIKAKNGITVLTLAISFLPLLLVLVVLCVPILFASVFLPGQRVALEDLIQPIPLEYLLLGACILCAICAIASSIMFFLRKTPLAVLGGIASLLLNGLISFAFGVSSAFVGFSLGGC